VSAIVLGEYRDISELLPDAPELLKRILAKTLALRPGDRYYDVQQLRLDLECLLHEFKNAKRKWYELTWPKVVIIFSLLGAVTLLSWWLIVDQDSFPEFSSFQVT
jgi:hypothetical protein